MDHIRTVLNTLFRLHRSRCTVFDALLQTAQALLIQPSCPICRASLEGNPAAKTGAELQPCGLCIEGYDFCQTNSSLKAALGAQ